MTRNGWITSRIAMCQDCDWRCEENDRKTLVKAYNHAKNKNHFVSVEVAKAFHYNFRKTEAKLR